MKASPPAIPAAPRVSAIERPGRRSRLTRAGLVGAARALLEEEGVAALTVRAVTDRAGVAHGTFYHHFPSTEAVLAAAIEDSLREFAEGMVASFADSPDKAWVFVASMSRAFRMLASHRAIAWMLERPQVLARAIREAFGPYSRRDLEAMVAAGDIDAAVLAHAGHWWEWVIVGALADVATEPAAASRFERRLLEMVLRALGLAPARIDDLVSRLAAATPAAARPRNGGTAR